MRRLILIYNIIIITIIIAAGFLRPDTSGPHPAYSLLFLPPIFYFLRQLTVSFQTPAYSTPSSSLAIRPGSNSRPTPTSRRPQSGQVLDPEVLSDKDISDINRRLFLKLIGSAGLATFTFSLFTKRTHAAFFGSIPGPGTIAIKDSNDNVIDPAEKQPTDGYEIAEVDDQTLPAYYGFLDKDGRWYIAREGTSGDFRYAAGTSDFSTSWTGRTSIGYAHFSNVF